MASNNTYSHSINLRHVLESQKLSGENFLDWEKNLRIVLDCERKLYILETDPPKTPKANARASELTSFKKYEDDARDVKCIIMANLDATVYNVDVKRSKPNSLNITYLWHCRLGHISEKRISKLRHSGVLDSFDLESYDVCQSCLLGKMTKAPFTGHGERASDVLGLIHSDVCGPINTEARGGFSYFVTFTDDLSRYGYVYLMKHKSECFDKFKEFRNEAVESTPYELWRGTKPNLSYLRIWGCDVYVRRLMTSSKLDSKSDRCKFVGYPNETKGYEFYNPTDNKIFVARNRTFLEKEFLSAISSGRKVDLEEIREPQEEISIAVEPERQDIVSRPAQVLPRRSDRMRNPPVRYGFLVSDEGDVLLVDQGESETYLKAITCPESEQWLNAMKSEMESMYTNQTWLSENFAMKDLGNASYALGIRIYRDRSRKLIGLCQNLKYYVLRMCTQALYWACRCTYSKT
ncbi:unnamed protein product [Cuscuta campestris]|uniref:Uncharacterized protein n=1 Tax=Cuscuta campestris TaxID=132261 RepID=A0A484LHP2_9ASTE|nr:unnamed protein product [Cuscuta campestris]